MGIHITEDQKRALADDGIVKLPGLIDSALLDELNTCFEWSIAHPGALAVGKPEGENISFVDNSNPDAKPMYDDLVRRSGFGSIAAQLWGSQYVGYFAEEIFWAGILSIRRGQWEAARSTGLGHTQTIVYVIIPQAIRMTVAPLTNRTIAITKNTALGTVIVVGEILNQASTAQSFSGNATPLMMGAIAYIVLFIPVVAVGRWIEARFAWRRI